MFLRQWDRGTRTQNAIFRTMKQKGVCLLCCPIVAWNVNNVILEQKYGTMQPNKGINFLFLCRVINLFFLTPHLLFHRHQPSAPPLTYNPKQFSHPIETEVVFHPSISIVKPTCNPQHFAPYREKDGVNRSIQSTFHPSIDIVDLPPINWYVVSTFHLSPINRQVAPPCSRFLLGVTINRHVVSTFHLLPNRLWSADHAYGRAKHYFCTVDCTIYIMEFEIEGEMIKAAGTSLNRQVTQPCSSFLFGSRNDERRNTFKIPGF